MSMQVARIIRLADQVAADIECRGLQPGDAYHGTEQTARMLRVSAAAANRALQVLVKRGVLRRRQGLGTYIAQMPEAGSPPLERVRLLVREDFLATEGLLADGVLIGLQGELPGASVQIDFVPAGDSPETMEKLICEALQAPRAEGFVLARATLETQRLVRDSGLPAVVYGTLHPSAHGMAWMDRDHRQLGALLAEHLLARGFRRMVLLLRQYMSPGDHLALDEIRRVFAQAGLGLEDVVLRCLPSDKQAVAEEVATLWRDDPRPTGFFCRNERLAEGVEAANTASAREAREVGIVVADVYRKAGAPPPRFPHARPVLTPEEIGRRLGQLLVRQTRGMSAGPDSELIPVCLNVPAGAVD